MMAYSAKKKTIPRFRAISGTMTDSAPKTRQLDCMPPEEMPDKLNVTVSKGGWLAAVADARWTPQDYDDSP